MHLTKLTCRDFRCLSDLVFEPEPGVNVVAGLNGQGKTSVLEALLYAATSKSHRTNTEQDLVARNTEGFRIAAHVQRADRDVSLEANWYRGSKRFKVNGVALTRVSDILGKVNVVLFSPEDLTIVKGAAAQRRQFLDMELSQVHAPYLAALQQYRHILRQRNELLRADSVTADLLAPWDAQLVRHGSILIQERNAYVSALGGYAAEAYSQIAPGESLTVAYDPDVGTDDNFDDVLRKNHDRDRRRQMTTRGPHRDDLRFTVSGEPARTHASQGQQKTTALALRLAEMHLVHDRTGEYPILMLDDVMSELDQRRAAKLLSSLPEGLQCILTTTDTTPRKEFAGVPSTFFMIEQGELTRAKKS